MCISLHNALNAYEFSILIPWAARVMVVMVIIVIITM